MLLCHDLLQSRVQQRQYSDLRRARARGNGTGRDSGTGYFVDGKLAADHSLELWYRNDESANRFGQFKGTV